MRLTERILLIVSVTLFAILSSKGQYTKVVDIQKGILLSDTTLCAPEISMHYTDDGIFVSYNFKTARILNSTSEFRSVVWKYDGFPQITIDSMPSLPQRTDLFFIEKGMNVDLEIIESEHEDYNLKAETSRNPILENRPQIVSNGKIEMVSYDGFEPQLPISIGVTQYRKNAQLIPVLVSPVSYDNDEEILRVYHTLTYRVKIISSDLTNEVTPIENCEYEDLCKVATPLRERHNIHKANGIITRTPPGYLIISPSIFREAAEKLAEWKRCTGYNVVCRYYDTWNQNDINSTVKYYYENSAWLGKKPLGESSLEYVLLMGTSDFISSNSHTFMDSGETINYFSDIDYFCMDGEKDKLPDIYYGRLLVNNPEQANVVTEKIINYERNGVSNVSTINDAIFVAGFWDEHIDVREEDYISDGYEDTPFVETLENIRQVLKDEFANVDYVYRYNGNLNPTNWTKFTWYCNRYNPGASLPPYMLTSDFNWKGKVEDTKRYWNKGASLIYVRDHGINGIWGDPNFKSEDADDLTNGDNLPFMFAVYCDSGKLNSAKGVVQNSMYNPKGGLIGAIAASGYSFSGYNDEFLYAASHLLFPQKGIRSLIGTRLGLDSWGDYTYPVRNPAKLLDLSWILAINHTQQFPQFIDYSREVYHCIADPSINIYIGALSKFFSLDVTRNDEGVYAENSGTSDGNYTFFNTKTKEIVCVNYVKDFFYETPYADYVVVSFKKENSITKINIGKNAILNYIK